MDTKEVSMQDSGIVILETESLVIKEVHIPGCIAEIENKIDETIVVHTGDSDSDEHDIVVKANGKAFIMLSDKGKAQLEAIRVGNYYWSIK